MLKKKIEVNKAVKILLDVFDPFDNRWSSKIVNDQLSIIKDEDQTDRKRLVIFYNSL